MAAEQILPQPVIFNRVNDCNCANSVKDDQVIVKQGDITQWQFSNAPCADAIDVYFVDGVVGTWTIAGELYCHTAGAPGVIAGTSILQDNQPYQIIVDVKFPNGENGTVEVIIGNISLGTITTPGRYFFYYNNSIPGDNRLAIGVTADFDGCIQRVQILPFNELWRVLVKDTDGIVVASFEEPTQIWRIQNRFITFRLDWDEQGIPDGCYTVCLADPCVNTCSQNRLIGQDFRDPTEWNLSFTGGGALVIDPNAGFLQWGVSGLGDTGTAQNDNFLLCDGITYEVTFTLSSVINAGMQVSVGGTLGSQFGGNGTFTEQITSAGITFSIGFIGLGAGSLMQITDLSIKAIDADIASNFTSEQFNVKAKYECTKVMNWCNDLNEDFGMGWQLTNFSPNVRLPLRAYQPEIDIVDRKVVEASNGRKTNDYVRARINKRLVTDLLPDYMIEAIMLGVFSDHLYIDGEEKFLENDEITATWAEDNTNRGTLTALIGDQTQLFENKRCTAEENPCPEILGANIKIGQFLLILGNGTTLNVYK